MSEHKQQPAATAPTAAPIPKAKPQGELDSKWVDRYKDIGQRSEGALPPLP